MSFFTQSAGELAALHGAARAQRELDAATAERDRLLGVLVELRAYLEETPVPVRSVLHGMVMDAFFPPL